MRLPVVLVFLFCLFSTFFAVSCNVDAVVNSGSSSAGSCIDMPGNATCFAIFNATGSQNILQPEDLGPENIFAWRTSPDGTLGFSYDVDSRYEFGLDYNAQVKCANATGSDVYSWTVKVDNYRNPSFLSQGFIWLRDNVFVVFVAMVVIFVAGMVSLLMANRGMLFGG